MTTLVTGGMGFIGSNFVLAHLNRYPNDEIVVVDNMSYAASRSIQQRFEKDWRVKLSVLDIRDMASMEMLYMTHSPDITFHFAAESHVDNSIRNDNDFVSTNINGTHNILKCVKRYGGRLVHVSTDEVYGSLGETSPSSTESSAYAPRNPYSATKAASDHLVMSYRNTYKLDAAVTNCGNNYGPRQHGEKFIPTIIRNALADCRIPLYGDGSNIRDWIFVDDHCQALLDIGASKDLLDKYNIGANNEVRNIDVAKKILDILGKPHSLISLITDRPGHDKRYSIDSTRIRQTLGWSPKTSWEDGLTKTVEWYKNA